MGGESSSTFLNDTWEFDGADWTRRFLGENPPFRKGAAVAFDQTRGKSVLFGGLDLDALYAEDRLDTFELTFVSAVEPEACIEASSDADNDGLAGCDDPDCAYRCTPTCSPRTSCNLANEPHCGDGACNSNHEDYLICPSDCAVP